MIARIWHGWTRPENADTYEALLRETILPGIAGKGIRGYQGAHLLRRTQGTEEEFITVLWFDDLECVRAFVGDDIETAYVPDAARRVLQRFDARSQHYEVLRTPDADLG